MCIPAGAGNITLCEPLFIGTAYTVANKWVQGTGWESCASIGFLPPFANGLRRYVPDTVWLLDEYPKSVALTLRIATPLLPCPNTTESWGKAIRRAATAFVLPC